MSECTTHHDACDCREAAHLAYLAERKAQHAAALTKRDAEIARLWDQLEFERGLFANESKYRREAEAERDALRARIADAPVAVVSNTGSNGVPNVASPLTELDASLWGRRVALVVVEDKA